MVCVITYFIILQINETVFSFPRETPFDTLSSVCDGEWHSKQMIRTFHVTHHNSNKMFIFRPSSIIPISLFLSCGNPWIWLFCWSYVRNSTLGDTEMTAVGHKLSSHTRYKRLTDDDVISRRLLLLQYYIHFYSLSSADTEVWRHCSIDAPCFGWPGGKDDQQRHPLSTYRSALLIGQFPINQWTHLVMMVERKPGNDLDNLHFSNWDLCVLADPFDTLTKYTELRCRGSKDKFKISNIPKGNSKIPIYFLEFIHFYVVSYFRLSCEVKVLCFVNTIYIKLTVVMNSASI